MHQSEKYLILAKIIIQNIITVARVLNKLTHSKRLVGVYMGFTQIAAGGGKHYRICGK
jgi:hypothetical protein